MNHSGFTEEQQKALHADLLDVGDKLANPPSSLVELHRLLMRTEHVLSQVPQMRACQMLFSVQDGIHPIMKALILEKIFDNCFLSIQVAVASCINEITRIIIPDYPYSDAQMKRTFMLFLFILEQLSCGSGKNYERALRILENMAERKTCLIMLDLEVDMSTMVVEMFRLFLETIKPDHSSNIFNHMKTIMILIIQESYDFDRKMISDLYETLLSSVRMDNKNTSPRSWELGKAVMENCTTILQQNLREVMKEKNLKVVDYAEIVASLCQDAPIGNDTVADEEVATDQDANEEVECIQVTNEEVTIVHCTTANASGDGVPKLDGRSQASQETQIQTERRRRKIKPNTLMRPDEGYQHARLGGDNGYSQKESYCVKKVRIGKRDQSKNKESTVNQDNTKEVSKKQKKTTIIKHSASDLELEDNNGTTAREHESEDVLKKVLASSMYEPTKQSRANEKSLNKRKKTTKSSVVQSDELDVHKEHVSHSVVDPQRHDEIAITSQKHDICEVGNIADKVVESPASGKAKYPTYLNSKKKKKPEALGLQYGQELVNYRVMVWWPLDQTYYTGTVESYDPITKKHKIEYDDGDEEILDMSKEIWHGVDDSRSLKAQTSRKRDTNPSPTKALDESQNKTKKG